MTTKTKLIENSQIIRQLQPRLEVLALGRTVDGDLKLAISLTFGARNPLQVKYFEQTVFGTVVCSVSSVSAQMALKVAFGAQAEEKNLLIVNGDWLHQGQLAAVTFIGDAAVLFEHKPESRQEIERALSFSLNEALNRELNSELCYAREAFQMSEGVAQAYVATSNLGMQPHGQRTTPRRPGQISVASANAPLFTWRRAAVGGFIAIAAFFALSMFKRPPTNAQPDDPLAQATQLMDPAAIKGKVNEQLAALQHGGGNPYSNIDTKNIQIETLKKLGFDVGKAKSGCLVGVGGPS